MAETTFLMPCHLLYLIIYFKQDQLEISTSWLYLYHKRLEQSIPSHYNESWVDELLGCNALKIHLLHCNEALLNWFAVERESCFQETPGRHLVDAFFSAKTGWLLHAILHLENALLNIPDLLGIWQATLPATQRASVSRVCMNINGEGLRLPEFMWLTKACRNPCEGSCRKVWSSH